jgi:hypothetical protein
MSGPQISKAKESQDMKWENTFKTLPDDEKALIQKF